jgi:hypothetical protein
MNINYLDELRSDDFCSDGLHEAMEEVFLIIRCDDELQRAIDRVAQTLREAYEDVSTDQSLFFADGVLLGLFLAERSEVL